MVEAEFSLEVEAMPRHCMSHTKLFENSDQIGGVVSGIRDCGSSHTVKVDGIVVPSSIVDCGVTWSRYSYRSHSMHMSLVEVGLEAGLRPRCPLVRWKLLSVKGVP